MIVSAYFFCYIFSNKAINKLKKYYICTITIKNMSEIVISESFKNQIWLEYPIPQVFSIWSGDGVNTLPLKDLDGLIKMCVEDVATDILITEYINASGMVTQLPLDTVTVMYGMMDYQFQGNRQVKVSFDKATKRAMLRYFPASIAYQRKMHVEDIDLLQGDRLIFFRCYVMHKMADNELSMLKTMNMNIDNGAINLEVLDQFSKDMMEKVKALKEDTILMYSPTNG